jgi:hypothetical protein
METAPVATTTSTAPPASPPASTSPAPSRSGVIPDAHYDQLADSAEQAKYARVKKPGDQGGSEWVARDSLSAEGTDPIKPAASDGKAASVTEDGRLKVGDYELSSDDIAVLLQQKAANDLRATQIPADGAYEAKLPESLKLPDGVEFRIDTADPALQDFRALAQKIGLSQSEFSEFIGVYAAKTAASEAAFRNSMKAELDKLGSNATVRVTALQTFFRGHVGDDLARAVCSGLFSAKQVEALEKIANKMTSQGAASFSQAHREPAGPQGRVSEEQYAAMSPSERWDYARGFDQRQFK